MNYIGNLRIFGYTVCAIIMLLSTGFGIFTIAKRGHPTIRKSQPPFLLMICVGTLLIGSAIIPLSFDDENYSEESCSIACMAVPWLLFIGFVTAFSALFSKIWRVNKILHSPNRFKRITVTEKDVLAPFAVLMTANLITLICWTAINPLTYERLASSGTDHWNRVYKSFYGSCVSSTDAAGGHLPYVIILVLVNCIAVAIANIQAYRARKIEVELSESKYIALATASMLQAFFIGIPIITLLNEDPQASYIVASMLIFVTCLAVLLLIFVPKILYMREYNAARAAKKSRQGTGVPNGSSDSEKDEQRKE